MAVAVPLALAAVLMPALRGHGRLRGRLSAVAAGLVAGALPWVVEAEARFGGVRNRLAEADEVQGGLGAVFSLRNPLTALDGPLLCRPCTGDTVRLPVTEWWVLLPLLVGLRLWAERRARRSAAPLWLAVAVAAATAVPYLFLVPYAAPRFLLPAYALPALPAAVGLLSVVHRARTRRSLPTAAVLTLALLGHGGIQADLVHTHAGIQQRARGDWDRIASVLREHGVHPPCVLAGNRSTIPLAHTAGRAPSTGSAHSGEAGSLEPVLAVGLSRLDPGPSAAGRPAATGADRPSGTGRVAPPPPAHRSGTRARLRHCTSWPPSLPRAPC